MSPAVDAEHHRPALRHESFIRKEEMVRCACLARGAKVDNYLLRRGLVLVFVAVLAILRPNSRRKRRGNHEHRRGCNQTSKSHVPSLMDRWRSAPLIRLRG